MAAIVAAGIIPDLGIPQMPSIFAGICRHNSTASCASCAVGINRAFANAGVAVALFNLARLF